MKTIIAALCLITLICGCAGTYFTFDKAAQVKVGMTENEVNDIMGKPYGIATQGDKTTWVYVFVDGIGGRQRNVSYVFNSEGQVVEVPRIPQSFLTGNTNKPVTVKSPKGS